MTDNARENVDAFGSFDMLPESDVEENDSDREETNDDEVCWEDCREFDENEIPTEDSPAMTDECESIYSDICQWSNEKLIRLGCINHALQLVIKECLKKNPRSTEIIAYLKKLTTFFSTSPYWHSKLVELTKKGLIKIGDTRWNGILFSLKRLLEVC
ncbi:unnamed protein product [Allacma fusca]|uniref:Uncharacterized protein n=1 Tax=Allacma fusca TaxID=39272 RepID=A0A8J2PLV9_9HEXA|nr:unnamed protein product [Allacma fusca]